MPSDSCAFAVDLKQLSSTHTFCIHEALQWLSSFQRIVSSMSCAARDTHYIYYKVSHYINAEMKCPARFINNDSHDLKRMRNES